MNNVPTSSPGIAQTDAKLTLLIKWIRWFSRALLIVGIFFYVVFAIRQSPASLIFAIIMTLIYYPASLYGLKAARKGRAKPAIYIIIFVCWSLALAIAGRGTTALPASLPMLLLPMIIALPYASNRDLLKIATGALVVYAGAVALTLHGSFLGVPAHCNLGACDFSITPLTATLQQAKNPYLSYNFYVTKIWTCLFE